MSLAAKRFIFMGVAVIAFFLTLSVASTTKACGIGGCGYGVGFNHFNRVFIGSNFCGFRNIGIWNNWRGCGGCGGWNNWYGNSWYW